MTRFFVDRPIVAIVIAILTVILGVVALVRPPHRAVPVHHSPRHPDPDHVHGRRRAHHRAVGGHADRAADERRGEDALRPVHERRRRHHDAVRHLRRGDRRQHRPGERAEPRGPGPAEPPRGREPVRPQLSQHRRPPAADLRDPLAQGELRRALPRQLRGHQRQRRPVPRQRGGPGPQLRPLRICDAGLGQAGQAGQAGADRSRPGEGLAAAEHGQPLGPHRGGAGAAGTAAHLHRTRRRGGWSRRRSSATSSSVSPPTGRRCGSRTSPASSWAPRTTTSPRATTAARARSSPCSRLPAPMPWPSPTGSRR